ncbi:MAG TPA: DUF2231 domain-containing protein, partial [Blastocatellia bacterium]|nr:DUF2231 domain-containing protein [Blastocatellia bacterium]
MSIEMTSAIDVIERQGWLDQVADRVQPAVTKAYDAAGTPGTKVKDALHGTWLGHPLHPVLTDVPIGAWTMALVLDVMEANTENGWRNRNLKKGLAKAADTAVTVGLLGAVGAAVTGITDWSETEGNAKRVGVVHGLLNVGATLLYTSSLVARKRNQREAGRTLAYLGYAVSSASAYLGGELVFREQAGVNHAAAQELPHEFVRVMPDAELAEGGMCKHIVSGVPVVLLRRQGKIYALYETCSHFGGPLAEGEIVNGDSIRCP